MNHETNANGSNGNKTTEPSTALVRREEVALSPYEPRDYAEAKLMAKDYAGSKLTKARTPEQAWFIMAAGAELGMKPTTALRMLYLADFGQGDQVCISADAMVAVCLRDRRCEYFRCEVADDTIATYVTKRVGNPERRRSFTDEDRKRARLGFSKDGTESKDSNWAKYRQTMLMHRAASMLAREVFPDVVGGFYIEEELHAAAREMAVRIVDAEVIPLAAVAPTAATATSSPTTSSSPAAVNGGSPTGSYAAPPAEEMEARVARLAAALRAATSPDMARPIVEEIKTLTKGSPEREELAAVLAERKKVGWVVEQTVGGVHFATPAQKPEPPREQNPDADDSV